MFAKTSEDYHVIPPALDFPIQALNPSLQRPNPLVYIELTAGPSNLGKLVFELFQDEAPRAAHNFLTLCCGDPHKVRAYCFILLTSPPSRARWSISNPDMDSCLSLAHMRNTCKSGSTC